LSRSRRKILDHREKHGAFSSVDELDAVSGIGPKRVGFANSGGLVFVDESAEEITAALRAQVLI
jgi:hypothetical protein